MNLLDLPYDIRHLIYSHLFPRVPSLSIILSDPPGSTYGKVYLCNVFRLNEAVNQLPTQLFLVNRGIHTEACEYFYHSYLFNLIGDKADCLAVYQGFADVVRKHARGEEVNVHALSNGEFSGTMCVSIQVGEVGVECLRKRKSGIYRSWEQIRLEVAARPAVGRFARRWRSLRALRGRVSDMLRRHVLFLLALFSGVIAAVVAAWLRI